MRGATSCAVVRVSTIVPFPREGLPGRRVAVAAGRAGRWPMWPTIAPAFRIRRVEVGGEAGMPRLTASEIEGFMLREQLSARSERAACLFAYADRRSRSGAVVGGAALTTSTRCATGSSSATGSSARAVAAALRRASRGPWPRTRSRTACTASRRSLRPGTTRPIRVLERAGFTREGMKRRFLRHGRRSRRRDALRVARPGERKTLVDLPHVRARYAGARAGGRRRRRRHRSSSASRSRTRSPTGR